MLYLAFTDGTEVRDDEPGPWEDLFSLRPGLTLIVSPHSRSRVYHGLKDLMPSDAALLVAPLADVPKFKNMAPGALAWARQHETGQPIPT